MYTTIYTAGIATYIVVYYIYILLAGGFKFRLFSSQKLGKMSNLVQPPTRLHFVCSMIRNNIFPGPSKGHTFLSLHHLPWTPWVHDIFSWASFFSSGIVWWFLSLRGFSYNSSMCRRWIPVCEQPRKDENSQRIKEPFKKNASRTSVGTSILNYC